MTTASAISTLANARRHICRTRSMSTVVAFNKNMTVKKCANSNNPELQALAILMIASMKATGR